MPGNHDVERVLEKDDAATFRLVEELRHQQRHLDEAFDDPSATAVLARRMRNYLDFATRLGPGPEGNPAPEGLFWSRRRRIREGLSVRIVGLNTALLANDDHDERRLWLGRQQLSHAFADLEDDELVIVLSHHPPGWLGDGAEVERWLSSRADLLLSGHTHDQRSLLTQFGGGRPFIHFSAGALHEAPDTTAHDRFTFSFGAVSADNEGRLRLQVWPFTWTEHLDFRPDPRYFQSPERPFVDYSLDAPLPVTTNDGAATVPVTRADDPSTPAPALPSGPLEEALEAYKNARAKEPRICSLDLNGLVGISPGDHLAKLGLLDFAVAPSLHKEADVREEDAAALRRQLRAPELKPSRRREIEAKLEQLELDRWEHHAGRHEPMSFGAALHAHRYLTIIGDPGAGKSVLTRLAFLACTGGEAGERARALLSADDWFNRDAVGIAALRGLLPVRLTLGESARELARDPRLSPEELLRRQLREREGAPLLIERFDELLTAGRLFLLCDGFDEIPRSSASAWPWPCPRSSSRSPTCGSS